MALIPGTQLGPYKVLAPLGSGGMGELYRARDERLEREVALKVLPATQLADEFARRRLQQEARTASALNHPHICTIVEVGEAESQVYVAMELVKGRLLKAIIPSDGLPAESLARYGAQVADALAHAHEHGIVHRDLKSANVMITEEGRAKILDFGLAVIRPTNLSEATQSREILSAPDPLAAGTQTRTPTSRRSGCADRDTHFVSGIFRAGVRPPSRGPSAGLEAEAPGHLPQKVPEPWLVGVHNLPSITYLRRCPSLGWWVSTTYNLQPPRSVGVHNLVGVHNRSNSRNRGAGPLSPFALMPPASAGRNGANTADCLSR